MTNGFFRTLKNIESVLLSEKQRDVVMGIELELYLVNKNNSLNYSEDKLYEILNKVNDKYIYKDYYNFQIELKTKPYLKVSNLMNDLLRKLEKLEILNEYEMKFIPCSFLQGAEQYNGLHIHISIQNKTNEQNYRFFKKYYHLIYFYAMMLSPLSFSSPSAKNILSLRLKHSNCLCFSNELKIRTSNENRMLDIVFNEKISNVKQQSTLEIRLFDVPLFLVDLKILLSHIKTFIEQLDIQKANLFLEKYKNDLETLNYTIRETIYYYQNNLHFMINPFFAKSPFFMHKLINNYKKCKNISEVLQQYKEDL